MSCDVTIVTMDQLKANSLIRTHFFRHVLQAKQLKAEQSLMIKLIVVHRPHTTPYHPTSKPSQANYMIHATTKNKVI